MSAVRGRRLRILVAVVGGVAAILATALLVLAFLALAAGLEAPAWSP